MSLLKYFVAIFLLITLGACSSDSNEPESMTPEMETPQDNEDDMNGEEEEQEEENVFEGDVLLTNQDEVDSFGSNNYERITGDLRIFYDIDTPSGPTITNLSSLSTIKNIERTLSLNQLIDLNNLTGLENIESIGLSLFITNCSGLSNINALSNTDIEFDLFLNDNQNIETLPDFTEIQNLNRVFISNQNSLQEINTLNNLINIDTSLDIVNESLISIEGFNNLESINRLKIVGQNLSSVNGFQSLNNVNESIEISNTLLNNIDFLSNITDTQSISINNLQLPDAPIINLEGLLNVQRCNSLSLQFIKINDITALSGLEELNTLVINNCFNINSLDGLENLTSLYQEGDSQLILISQNSLLEDYCALSISYLENFESSQYEVLLNAFDPSLNNLINGICSN